MSLKEELTDFIYRFIITSCIAGFLFLEIYNFYDPELIDKGNVISILLISLSFNVLLLIYHKIHLYIIPAVFLVITVAAFILDEEDVILILNSVFLKLMIIGLVAFIVFLITDTSVLLCLLMSLGVLVYMFFMLFGENEIHPVSPTLGFFYIAVSAARVLRRKKDGNAQRNRTYITFLLPFIMALPITIAVLPKPDEPISWNWVKRLYEIAADKINEIVHEISLSFSSSEEDSIQISFGYNEKMTYDNDSGNDSAIMEIKPQSQTYQGTYLKGEIFNVFKNGEWYNSLETDRDYSAIDTLETFYGIVNFDEDLVYDIMRNSTISVRYLDLTTRVMFMPSKILRVNSGTDELVTSFKNEHILFDERKTYGTEYGLDYFQMNYGSRPFVDYMQTNVADNAEVLQNVKKKYLKTGFNNIDFSDIMEYREYIKQSYTSSPEVLSSVKNWVESCTSEKTNDYDKLKEIERVLSSWEYTFEGGGLPDYVKDEGDFLNYFILERRKGYCVHYATAFCLLARYMGYPARVVQGFMTSLSQDKRNMVNNSDGHSWPEVYFEGKGWVAFEPTPGFGKMRYSGWSIFSGKYSEFEETDFSYLQNRQEAVDIPVSEEDAEYLEKKSENRVSGLILLIIAAIVILSIILLVTVSIIANRLKKKRLGFEKLYLYEFRCVLQILKELGITREKEETLDEFASKSRDALEGGAHDSGIDGSMAESWDTSFISCYEGIIYGNGTVGEEEMEEIVHIRGRLMKLLKKHFGATYPLHRLRLYISQNIIFK